MAKLLGLTDNKDILFVQAYLLLQGKRIDIDEVFYIRTKGKQIADQFISYWEKEGVRVNVTPIDNEGRIKNESDNEVLEEQLMLWYQQISSKHKDIYVFVGGGHKLHSLALQKCAFLFGAQDTFHMFVNVKRENEPQTVTDVKKAIDDDIILYASLGKESGWPALTHINTDRSNIREQIQAIQKAISSRNVDTINEYPFECINLLPSKAIEWLMQPLQESDNEWVRQLPKTELHCHLGGFATHGDLLCEVRNAAQDILPVKKDIGYPDNWPIPPKPIDLKEYMALGDNNGSYLLKDSGCLQRQCELLYNHFMSQNIRYAEVRCSPYNYASGASDGIDVLNLIRSVFDQKMEEAGNEHKRWCHVNLIIIATRKPNQDLTSIIKHIALATAAATQSKTQGRCKVVGIDLAGYEHKDTRAAYYEQNFEPIHRAGVGITIHAGENDDAEGIWQAVFKLNTRRIGHGLRLYQSPELIRSVIDRKIGVEMCPYANYQIVGFNPMPDYNIEYPLLEYLKKGIQVCINTDNIGISKANLTANIMLLTRLNPGITRMQVLQLVRNGLEQTFIDNEFKKHLIRFFNQDVFELIFFGSQSHKH